MHFSINKEHRDFYSKNQWIEVEGIFNPSQIEALLSEIAEVMGQRLKENSEKVLSTMPEKIFQHGRDLWRDNPAIKKTLFKKSLAEVVSELIQQKPLRFGFDQLYPAPDLPFVFKEGYSELLSKSYTLKEMTCIQGVLCGAILCVKPPASPEAIKSTGVFPITPGSITFISPDLPLPFEELNQRSGALYIMIVYVQKSSVYTLEERDPHTHAFKQIGYALSDKLSDKLNPIVFS